MARNIVRKLGGYYGTGGYAMDVFQGSAEFGDTRRAAISASDAYNRGIAILFNFRPQGRVIAENRDFRTARSGLYRRHVPGEPAGYFLHKIFGAMETRFNRIDDIPFQGVQPGCH
jgi:hypothetical protein